MDEKKKTIVVGVLFVVMLGIGAFQFMPKGEPPKPAETKKPDMSFLAENEQAKTEDAPLNPQVAAALSPRDPFKVPDSMSTPNVITGAPTPPTQKATLKNPTRSLKGNVALAGSGTGKLGVDPMPSVGGGPAGVGPAPVDLPPFGYEIGGVAVGARSAVVFKDAQGGQRLVLEGGALDGDTQVKAVNMDHVVVVYHGRMLRLPVGEKPKSEESPAGKK